jgi:hypothetical protein
MILNAGAAADQISIKIANLGNLQTNEILHSISTQKKKHSIVDLITCTFVQQFNLFHAKLVLLQQQHILISNCMIELLYTHLLTFASSTHRVKFIVGLHCQPWFWT